VSLDALCAPMIDSSKNPEKRDDQSPRRSPESPA
jgi:hypothetical protein